jgi:hypothetical protein
MVAEQSELSFAGLLRRLRAEARLTQEELAAAGVRGVGRGEVVVAAGWGVAADPGGWAGGRAGGGGVAVRGVHPDPGAAG